VRNDSRRILVKKADKGGAVKSLENNWIFYELSDGSTLVDFDVDVRLKAFPLVRFVKTAYELSTLIKVSSAVRQVISLTLLRDISLNKW